VLDHLVAWNAGSTNQEWYAYDASGNRVLLRSTTGSGTSITTYAFGLEEHLYGATGINTGNTYYYNLGGRLIGALTGITTLTPQFFLTDALGSVLATFSATAGSAAVLGNQVYGPYGNQRYTQGSMGTAKGYTGQYADATGLDYYNARYYDPVVGRFVSADTVQGNEQGMDPYAYVGGNPETMNDPTGHCDSWCMGASIVETLAETSDPIIGITAAAKVGGLYLNGLMDGQMPSADDVAKARMEGDIDGALFTIGSVGALACAVAEPCGVGAQVGWFGVGYGADTIIQTEFSDTFQKAADKFYQAHPVVDPKQDGPAITPRQDGPAVHPISINTIVIKAQSMIQQRGNTGSLTRAGVKKASSSVSRRTYTHTSTRSSSTWTQKATSASYSYTSTVYHYANPSYDYSTFSASNGYYQRNSGGMRMS
jgi:RHS repeat-associated protein